MKYCNISFTSLKRPTEPHIHEMDSSESDCDAREEQEEKEERQEREERERQQRLERERQLKARRAEEEKAKRLSFEIPKKYPLGLADPANNALLKAAQNAHIKDPVKAAAKAIAERLVNFLPLPTPPRSAALLPIHPRLLTPAPALQALLGAAKLPPLPNR